MRKTRTVILQIAIITAVFFFVSVPQALADDLLFDRGLPTANLNNDAGASRSNVSWADNESTSNPAQSWLPGDDFTLASNSNVNKITVWIVAGGTSSPGSIPTGLSLWGGTAGSQIAQISTSPVVSQTHYVGGQSYQGYSGNSWDIYQVDFAVNLNVKGGQTYDFFVNQPFECSSGDPCTAYANAFLSASNGPLSGSLQQQNFDGQFLWLYVNGDSQQVIPWNSLGNGWDKSSDANVQVFGSPTPEPGSIILLGSGLLGLVGVVRRKFGKCA